MLSRERLKKPDKRIGLVGLCGYERAFAASCGMQQLVGPIRALAVPPGLLCMNEPFSALGVLTALITQDPCSICWRGRR
jgi:NitT/TauT family transport system ATP-binding protein